MLITVIICLTTNCTSNSLIKELFVELLDRLLTSIHIPTQHIVWLFKNITLFRFCQCPITIIMISQSYYHYRISKFYLRPDNDHLYNKQFYI